MTTWHRLIRVVLDSPLSNPLITTMTRGAFRGLGLRPPDWCATHLPRIGITSCPLPNGRTHRLRSCGQDWLPNWIYWKGIGGFDPDMGRYFFGLATHARVVIDVGAHTG